MQTSKLPGMTIRLPDDIKEQFRLISKRYERSMQEQAAYVLKDFIKREQAQQGAQQ